MRYDETSWRILVGLVATTSVTPLLAQGVGTSVEPCPNAAGVTGYSTLEAINVDMMAELEKIRAGGIPVEPYMFELCPNTVFDTTLLPLTPLLSGSVFSCGSAAAPGSACNFMGGATQILIEDPVDVTGYDLEMVSFVGITFLGFTGSAISGGAGANTTVDVANSIFSVRWQFGRKITFSGTSGCGNLIHAYFSSTELQFYVCYQPAASSGFKAFPRTSQ